MFSPHLKEVGSWATLSLKLTRDKGHSSKHSEVVKPVCQSSFFARCWWLGKRLLPTYKSAETNVKFLKVKEGHSYSYRSWQPLMGRKKLKTHIHFMPFTSPVTKTLKHMQMLCVCLRKVPRKGHVCIFQMWADFFPSHSILANRWKDRPKLIACSSLCWKMKKKCYWLTLL